MPRVRVRSGTFTSKVLHGEKTYMEGDEIGVTDETYRANKEALEFISPTTDVRMGIDGQLEEKVRPDSKP